MSGEYGTDILEFSPEDGHGPALFAGFLGWTLDAFDFFLVILSLTAIAKEFHRSDKEIAFSIILTLAFRPVGAFIFGLMADRYGRRIPLMVDLVFYSVVEVLTGFAHSFATFLVLRALFGIGMGGEWGVGASLAMEKVSASIARISFRLASAGIRLRVSAGSGLFLFCVSTLGLAADVFYRRAACASGIVRPLQGKRVRGLAENSPNQLGKFRREICSHWKLFLYLTLS